MNDSTSASPASSSASDSDAFNTESARLYFGPVKTPERQFVANNKRLFPPAVPPLLRRSPRLSSPRPQPDPVDRESTAEESEDIDLVAQLVNEVDVDDEDAEMSTPSRDEGELEPDEPLSALADKILHAVDNPSPPPTPPPVLRTDRYPTNPDGIGDRIDFDVGHFDITEILAKGFNQAITSRGADSSDNQFFVPGPEIHPDENIVLDLISFDSPRQSVAPKPADELNFLPPQLMSVDDLLSKSPDLDPSSRPPVAMPALSTGQPAFNGEQDANADLMSVDSPKAIIPETQFSANPLISEHHEQVQRNSLQSQSITNASILPATPEIIATPLRRSLRPRKSMLPTPLSQTPTMAMDPPSIPRASVKEREAFRGLKGEPEREENRRSPSPSVLQNRQQSPDKQLPSFHRELGSLSPASTNVLSKLAFNIPVDSNGAEETTPRRSSLEPPTFSFSVFTPRGEAAGDVSTPVRSDGPQRVSSPPKAENSPKKFRLQMPIPNDAPTTPARRIPIEQAIAQGQLSPEKAAQLGFKASVNPGPSSASVSTPARRILVTDKSPHPVAKTSATLRYGSPTKQLGSRRERLVEPSQQTISLKGKGKAKAVSPAPQEVTSTIKPGKLPFPIVAAAPSTHSSSEPHQAVDQIPSTKLPSSPAKSTLKHVTSRIPRINSKPYARKTNDKVSAGALTLTVDSKPSSRPAENPTTTKKLIRLVETPKSIATSPTPRVRASSSTTLLKRKREAEKMSPIKPRTTFLRQVPSLATRTQTQIQSVQAPASGDQPAYDTIHVRRVVSPSPASKSHSLASKSPEPGVPEHHEDTIINEPRIPPPPILMESANPPEPSSAIPGPVDPPGSPMKQDSDHVQQLEAPQPPEDSLSAPPPTSVAEPVSSGLRRTTRARRTVVQPDAVAEAASRKTTRRKAASQADDVFSGMSMTALKELTMTNTARNQHYLAAKLETEVIRKEGLRPESPAVKIRTIVQRQQEEKDQQRAERAKRRARKSGNDEISASDDVEASSDIGYSSPCDNQEDVDMDLNPDVDGLPNKHRRGAGDEDDYVTPEKSLRGIRTRLFDDGAGDKTMEPRRRVKWDRGLYTLAYLDEVKLGSRQTLKENRILKGILAPTAKARLLDTLGNLLHTDTPLADLVPENVTVKKFVYDNDNVPAPEPPPPKITRSKSKRK